MLAITTHASSPESPKPPRAVIFDAYGTLFDVHSVVAAAEQLFPGRGDALSRLWRRKQIEYTQLRTLADPAGTHYEPFWKITVDALRHAVARLKPADALSSAAEKRLMDEYACLSSFPDTLPALKSLRDGLNIPLAILSNGDAPMLDIAVKSAGMSGLFDHVLSVDAVRAYKPAAAYALGTRAFGVAARDIVFASNNGWHAVGTTWFGYDFLDQPRRAAARGTRRRAARQRARHGRTRRFRRRRNRAGSKHFAQPQGRQRPPTACDLAAPRSVITSSTTTRKTV